MRLSLLGLSAFSGAPRPEADGYPDDPAGYHPSPLEASHACDGGAGGAGQGGSGGEEGGEQGPPSSEGAFSALPVTGSSGVLSQAEGGAAAPRLALTLTLIQP